MAADNTIYDEAGTSGGTTQALNALRTAVNPGRIGYLKAIIDGRPPARGSGWTWAVAAD